MNHYKSLAIMIFQTDNPMSATRLANYLGRNSWTRLSKGIYQTIQPIEDKETFSEKVRKEYLISDDDFLMFIDGGDIFIPTQIFYNRKAPNWPSDF
jgi:hypothetical protein